MANFLPILSTPTSKLLINAKQGATALLNSPPPAGEALYKLGNDSSKYQIPSIWYQLEKSFNWV